jgi:hypothetical protein
MAIVSRTDAQRAIRKGRKQAKAGLFDFTKYTFSGFETNWHHRVVCGVLDQFVSGDIKRLMVFMPPRHSKSELVSRRLPAKILGQFPDSSVISCSYGGDLANEMSLGAKRIISSPLYRNLYPGTRLPGPKDRDYKNESRFFQIPGHRGFYRGAGVGGGITGFGFNFGIIDDPVKDRMEAGSPTFRKRLKNWYTSTFRTRVQKNAGILLTCTRWHSDDLAGWLLKESAENPHADQWHVLSLPALLDEEAIAAGPSEYDGRLKDASRGKALWPGWFDEAFLLGTQHTIGEFDWMSLYQQRPSAGEGITNAYHAFSEANVQPVMYDPNLPIYWSLDFNITPMCSVIAQIPEDDRVSQIITGHRNRKIHILDEIGLLESGTEAACREFERRVLKSYYAGTPLIVYVYGDSTAARRDTRGNESDWQIIKRYFRNHAKIRLVVKTKKNPAVKSRISAVNAMLRSAAGSHSAFIHPRCTELRKDFEQVCWKMDMHGNTIPDLDDSDPMRTHLSDAFGYLVWGEFPLKVVGGPRSDPILAGGGAG